MKLLVDECCPLYLVEALREDEHDVLYVPEVSPSLADANILQQALTEERVIITEDNDFGEMVFRQQLPAYSVIFVRIPHNVSRDARVKRVRDLLSSHADQIPNNMITLTLDTIRIRPLASSNEE